jgi:hypothetical protein
MPGRPPHRAATVSPAFRARPAGGRYSTMAEARWWVDAAGRQPGVRGCGRRLGRDGRSGPAALRVPAPGCPPGVRGDAGRAGRQPVAPPECRQGSWRQLRRRCQTAFIPQSGVAALCTNGLLWTWRIGTVIGCRATAPADPRPRSFEFGRSGSVGFRWMVVWAVDMGVAGGVEKVD